MLKSPMIKNSNIFKFTILAILTCLLSAQSWAFSVNSTKKHEVIVLHSGTESLAQRVSIIQNATKSIDIEYFIYRQDSSSQIITQELIKSAKRGVKVRLLLDFFLNRKKDLLNPFFAHELSQHGIEIRYFNTYGTIHLKKFQYRNHRKIIISDGETLLTGGRNIGNEYFDMDTEFNFLDRDLIVRGEIVSKVQESFEIFWNSEYSKQVPREKRPTHQVDEFDFEDFDNGENFISNIQLKAEQKRWDAKEKSAVNFVSPNSAEIKELNRLSSKIENFKKDNDKTSHLHCNDISFVSDLPEINKPAVGILKDEILKRMNDSQVEVTIDSPYFVTNRELNNVLTGILKNDISLNVFTNGLYSTDATYVASHFYSHAENWIDRGTNIYIYNGSLVKNYPLLFSSVKNARWGTHGKSFLFDSKDTLITSFNFDPRSSQFNMESGIFCNNNPKFAKHIQKNINKKRNSSSHLKSIEDIEEKGFKNVTFWKRINFLLLIIPSNIFSYLI